MLLEQILQGAAIPTPLLASIAADADELMRLLQLSGYFVRRVWGIESPLLDRLLDKSSVTVADTVTQMSIGTTP